MIRRKLTSKEEERKRRGKSSGCALSFYIGHFVDSQFAPSKKPPAEEIYLAVTFPKARLDMCADKNLKQLNTAIR